MAEPDGLGPAAPPKKKSLFNKSTWAKPAAQKEGIDFFSRADELWPERLAEEERRRQKKEIKLERKRSTASAERKPSSPPDSKRRRVSQNEDERHSSEGSLNHEDPDEASWARRESTLSTPGSRKSNSTSQQKLQPSPISLVERYGRDLHAKGQNTPSKGKAGRAHISLSDSDEAGLGKSSGSAWPVNLDDEDDDVVAITSNPPIQLEDNPDDSDEEFPELARRARERAKQNEFERLQASHSFQNKNHNSDGSNTPINLDDDDIFGEGPAEDPMVEIFVTSVIENTVPMLLRRKLSQKLDKVKLAWCDKQNIPGQRSEKFTSDNIFLTWKRSRVLYDMTTCKSLGLKIDGSGQVKPDGEGSKGQVHLEAWTQDLYDSSQRRLKAKQEASSDDELEVVEQPVEKKIKLILLARGMEPLKISVKPTTPSSKLASAFRDRMEIPDGQEIMLRFDGDTLDPESTVGDVDLEDHDTVEVHLR